jgi:phosphinothricin acetyltransferase
VTLKIRNITESDLPQVVDILNPFILRTAITFDTNPYTSESRFSWFQQFKELGRHQCLVAEKDGKIIGYANSGRLREKQAYDTSVEVSIYKAQESNEPGLGTRLYSALFDKLSREDIHRAHALITLPNEASLALHKKFGFYEVGTLHEAGRKFDQYHSVFWMEKRLNVQK